MSLIVLFFDLGGSAVAVVVPPADDDSDTSVTTRTDRDGATLRPSRVTVLHAFDDARNAGLTGPDRTPLDRYWCRSSRAGRYPDMGRAFRVAAFASRAGETLAPFELVLDLEPAGAGGVPAPDTTGCTDRDGASLQVPTWRVMHAPNDARDASLATVGTDQDRHWTRHAIPAGASEGYWHRVAVQDDGRAGNAGCPYEVVLDLTVQTGQSPRAAAT